MKNVAHSPQMLNKWRLQLMQLTESIYLFIAKHPKANWFISIVFFFFLILNSSLTFLSKNVSDIKWDQKNVTPVDFCFYVASLLPAVPKQNDISIAQGFAIFDIFFVILFIVLIFIKDSIKMPFLQICFSVVYGYFLPVFFLVFCNIFNASYAFYQDDVNASTSLCMIFHIFLILAISINAVFNPTSPLNINSPFFAKGFLDSIFLLSYYLLFSIYNMNHQTTFFYIRGVISLIYSILIIFNPPYFDRKMNFLLLICSLYDMSCSFCVNFYNYECFICLAGSILVSFLIYYGFYYIPRCYKSDVDKIFHYGFIGKDKEAFELLSNITITKETKYYQYILIRYALKYNTPNAQDIISHFQTSPKNIKDIFFYWSAENALKIQNDEFIDQDIQIITSLSKDSDQYYNEFWHRVWLSDTASLIKLSAKLGSLHMKKVMYGIHNYKKNPKILDLYDDDMKIVLQNKINSNKFKEFFRKISKFDIFLLVTFLIFIGIHIFLISIRSKLFPIFKKYCLFSQLELEIVFLHSHYVINESDPIDPNLIDRIKNSAKDFYNDNSEYLNQYLVDDTQLFQRLNSTLFCLETNKYVNFLSNCYEDSKSLFSELTMINQNESVISTKEGRPSRPSFIIIVSLAAVLAVICLIFIIISLRSISMRITKYIQNFLMIPKSRVVQLAIFDQSIEIFNEMPSRWAKMNPLIHLPWTILAHAIFALFFILFCFSLDYSFRMSRSQGSHVNDVIQRMSLAIQVPMYSILDYTAELKDDNQTIKNAEEKIVQIVESLHDENMYEYLALIPSQIYSITFFSYSKKPLESQNMIFNELLNNMTSSMSQKINDEAYFHRCCIMGVIFAFYMICMSYLMSVFMMSGVSRMMNAEIKMPRILYRLAKSNSFLHSIQKIKRHLINSFNSLGIIDNSGNEIITLNQEDEGAINENTSNLEDEDSFIRESSEKDDIFELADSNDFSLDFSNIPIVLFVIDSNSVVVFSTKAAQDELGVKDGKPFKRGTIDLSIFESIQNQFNLFLNGRDSKSQVIIPTGNEDGSVIMKASYFYSNKKVNLNDVTVCFDSAQFKAEKIERKINKMFYKEFPNFISIDSEFPLELKPKLKSFIIIVLHLNKFSSFADNFDDFHLITNYRTDLSKDLFALVESQNNFSYIRESADDFIYSLNREQTAISVWKVLEASATFSKKLIKIVKKLNDKYNIVGIEPKIMLFKCKEPNWFVTKFKMATIDWESDVMLNAQLFNRYGKLNAINYSTQKKEMKAPNTTLLKILKTPNGDQFELFVVV